MPKRVWSSESDSPSPGPRRLRKAPQKRPRVLSPNGKDFKLRIQEGKAIVISDDDEAPVSAQPKSPTPVTLTHISDSNTDDSSLHGEGSPQRISTAEVLAREYQDALESDNEAGHNHTTESPPRKEDNDRRSYSIRCLAAEEQKITLELGELRKRIERDKAEEMHLAGTSTGIRQSIDKLTDSGL